MNASPATHVVIPSWVTASAVRSLREILSIYLFYIVQSKVF